MRHGDAVRSLKVRNRCGKWSAVGLNQKGAGKSRGRGARVKEHAQGSFHWKYMRRERKRHTQQLGLRCPFLDTWHPALAMELGQPEEEFALVFEAKSELDIDFSTGNSKNCKFGPRGEEGLFLGRFFAGKELDWASLR